MTEKTANKEKRFQGIPVSPGIAEGSVIVRSETFEEPDTYSVEPVDVERELQRFEDALIETRAQIRELQRRLDATGEGTEASIFDAHLLVLEDRSVLDEVKRVLTEEQENIESVFYRVMKRYIDSLRAIEDPYLRERAIDVEDVTRRVVRNLSVREAAEYTATHKHIVLAHDLTPSDTAGMDRERVLGFATETGSYTSHAAIMARSMNIPGVVGLHGICDTLHTGSRVLLDGYHGVVIFDPTAETVEEFEKLKKEMGAVEERLEELKDTKSVTRDGRAITLSANIEFAYETDVMKASGAEGIGLYRTEFFYLHNRKLPSEDQQVETYARVAAAVRPDEVIIRTMDVGGDKLPAERNDDDEMNPFLGWRGIRVSLERPGVFRTQIRSILRASVSGKVGIMFPLISGIEELRKAKEVVEACKKELSDEGIPFDEEIEIGAMIEVPSAALVADQLAPEVDFFSVGTNDLVQYTIAVDRVNDRVANLYQPAHPAILRLLKMVVDAGHANDIWVGLCGEMAGDVLLTPILVGLDFDELSVGASQIPRVKHAVRSLDSKECTNLVANALGLRDADEIVGRCRELAMRHYPELIV